jgi:hypothetical protein
MATEQKVDHFLTHRNERGSSTGKHRGNADRGQKRRTEKENGKKTTRARANQYMYARERDFGMIHRKN